MSIVRIRGRQLCPTDTSLLLSVCSCYLLLSIKFERWFFYLLLINCFLEISQLIRFWSYYYVVHFSFDVLLCTVDLKVQVSVLILENISNWGVTIFKFWLSKLFKNNNSSFGLFLEPLWIWILSEAPLETFKHRMYFLNNVS